MLKEDWKLAILDQVYEPFSLRMKNTISYDVLAHVNLVQKDEEYEELDYYEALIPEFNFLSIFISKNRIKKFL